MTAADGGVFILPAEPTITQSTAVVVQVTAPASLDSAGVDVDGARAAYVGWVAWAEQAMQEPGRDWAKEAAKWAAEPMLTQVLTELARAAKGGTHDEGHASYVGTVIGAMPNEVKLEVCTDTSGVDVIQNATGESVRSDTGYKLKQYVTVIRDSAGHWLVSGSDWQGGIPC